MTLTGKLEKVLHIEDEQQNVTYQLLTNYTDLDIEMNIKRKFPFHRYSEKELDDHIELAKSEIVRTVRERDFNFEDFYILTMGTALVKLEREKQQRKNRH